jgi:hypothetical protein
MRTVIALTAALALAGCGERAETTAADAGATTAAATTGEAPSPAANQPATGDMAGRYEITFADGKVMTETINADGSYVDLMDGEETRGRWRMDGAKSCFDPAGAAAEECYTASAPGADGSFTVTGADGSKATVRKIGAAPAATPGG